MMQKYPRSVNVPQEALNKSISINKNGTFLGVFLFPNMTKVNKMAFGSSSYGVIKISSL